LTKVSKDKDKSDYSVMDKVIDKKIKSLLEKWTLNGLFSEVTGIISAGKEANVYHASAGLKYLE
jgi:serine/threonine-protein kinase RIO1